MDNESIKKLVDEGVFSYTDIHFAGLMQKISGNDERLFLAAALSSSQAGRGHVCFDIETSARPQLADISYPEINEWVDFLKTCEVIGTPGEFKPLILEDGKRLYLYRYWEYQKIIADYILKQASKENICSNSEIKVLKDGMARLFPAFDTDTENNYIDWQKIAACISVIKGFSVISGGPGTGKTTTITKVLALFAEQWAASRKDERIRIFLTAPTGKAAARLKTSISETKDFLNCSNNIKNMIPDEASTIHRLLGPIKNTPYFRYNEKRKLSADIIVVDESSMVDLALMSKLVQAVPEDARMIIIGDQDQLASVAAGAVLGDICNTGETIYYSKGFCSILYEISGIKIGRVASDNIKANLSDCITVLKKSYRFDDYSGIKSISKAVNYGDDASFFNSLKANQYKDISVASFENHEKPEEVLSTYIEAHLKPVFKAEDIKNKLLLFDRSRILCAVRKGPVGVEKLNILIEVILRNKGIITTDNVWYPGRPVMITRNDYQTGLFNGDIGITVRSEREEGLLEVCFMDHEGEIRRVRQYSIPECETVYAMTVHKSQGSEFDNVLFVMPDKDVPVLTRELIYTGITRARRFVEIKGDKAIIRQGIRRRTERVTGLRHALWE